MKIFKTIILAALFMFFASWFYKIVVLILLAHTWGKEIKAKKEWGYRAVMGVLLIAMFCVLQDTDTILLTGYNSYTKTRKGIQNIHHLHITW